MSEAVFTERRGDWRSTPFPGAFAIVEVEAVDDKRGHLVRCIAAGHSLQSANRNRTFVARDRDAAIRRAKRWLAAAWPRAQAGTIVGKWVPFYAPGKGCTGRARCVPGRIERRPR